MFFEFCEFFLHRNDNNNKGLPVDVAPLPLSADKTEGTVALVKSSSEKIKTTPAGEYLTAALNDFNPEQYDNLAVISDGANKLLMLVCFNISYVFQIAILLSCYVLCCWEDLQWYHCVCSTLGSLYTVLQVYYCGWNYRELYRHWCFL